MTPWRGVLVKFKHTCECKFKPIQDINQGTSSKINEHLKMGAWQTAGDPKMFAVFVLLCNCMGMRKEEREES